VKTILRDVFRFAFPGLLLATLAACGGGGGGSGATQSSSPSPGPLLVPAPVEPFTMYPQTLGASSDGNSYAGTYTETPNQGLTMFDGQQAYSSAISLTITENGTPIVTEIETAYYLDNPYRPLGVSLSYNGEQYELLYNSTDPLPSMLAGGDSGPLGTGTYYAANSDNAIGSLTETYSVALGSGFLMLNMHASGTVNGESIEQTISYALNYSSGEVVGVGSVAILVNGTTLNFGSACEGCWDY
jgi:hypothetical protein